MPQLLQLSDLACLGCALKEGGVEARSLQQRFHRESAAGIVEALFALPPERQKPAADEIRRVILEHRPLCSRHERCSTIQASDAGPPGVRIVRCPDCGEMFEVTLGAWAYVFSQVRRHAYSHPGDAEEHRALATAIGDILLDPR